MPRASRFPVKKDIYQELEEYFTSLIASLRDPKYIDKFFGGFLTPEEKMMLIKRLMVYIMLENKYKTSDIGAVLHLSRETVRVHKQMWDRQDPTFREVIHIIAKKEKTKRFFEKIEKILRPIGTIVAARNNMKARAKLMSGELFD